MHYLPADISTFLLLVVVRAESLPAGIATAVSWHAPARSGTGMENSTVCAPLAPSRKSRSMRTSTSPALVASVSASFPETGSGLVVHHHHGDAPLRAGLQPRLEEVDVDTQRLERLAHLVQEVRIQFELR